MRVALERVMLHQVLPFFSDNREPRRFQILHKVIYNGLEFLFLDKHVHRRFVECHLFSVLVAKINKTGLHVYRFYVIGIEHVPLRLRNVFDHTAV